VERNIDIIKSVTADWIQRLMNQWLDPVAGRRWGSALQRYLST